MTDQEINIAIAEVCGWVNCRTEFAGGKPSGRKLPDGIEHDLPNYCGDLNAMRAALGTLTFVKGYHFVKYLMMEVGWDRSKTDDEISVASSFELIKTTACQQAKAFLKTVGKWKE